MSGPEADATAGFSGITGTNGPQASAFSSIMQSFASQASAFSAGATFNPQITTKPTSDNPETATATSASDRAPSKSDALSGKTTSATATSSPTSSRTRTTLVTSTIPSQSDVSSLPNTQSQSSSGTAANVAISNTATAIAVSSKCSSLSCNSGLQAAIAVPIVVVALLSLGALIFFGRRRRRRQQHQQQRSPSPTNEKGKPKKKWSRHLRVFSFGEELLMGGRFSSSNSLRTGDQNSLHSGQQSAHNGRAPSLLSQDEVAPPYRDTISQAERPATVTGPLPRPSSAATAPPPYAAAGRTSRATNNLPTTPTSTRSRSDPFRDGDSNPASPVDGSPFNDPEADDDDAQSPRPLMSRQSSMLDRLQDTRSEVSTLAGSETGSIREAQIARNVSMSGARTVNVHRSASQRGSNHS